MKGLFFSFKRNNSKGDGSKTVTEMQVSATISFLLALYSMARLLLSCYG
jgi:hypothetical protein